MTEAEKYYHSLLAFGIKPGLERIRELLKRLGDPQNKLRCIHVAGTNGKGTVCAFIAQVLIEQGYKTGLYTSPYIVDFRERIKIDGEMISENSLNNVTMRVKAEIENLNREGTIITEFEAVTAAAFLYYMESGCDYVVLETGLGGRFDATNVIEAPLLSIITSISLDHTKILGDTISKIAFEKCGIIKQNSIAVTNSNNHKDALEVIEKSCTEKGSELFIANTADLNILSESIRGTKIEYLEKEYSIPFCGYHQAENAITTITAINCLKSKGIDISDEAIEKGMKNAKNPARCEIVSENPLIIFDGCHNEASANALRLVIDKNLSGKKIVAVIGMMADKAVDTVLDILLPKLSFVCCTTVNNPRAISASELYNKVTEKGVEAAIIEKPCDALNYAKTLSSDLVLVCGSLYLCSELYENKDGMP